MRSASIDSVPRFDLAPGRGARLPQFVVIVLGHLLAFYFIYSGMLHRAMVVAMPQSMVVNFVSTPVVPEPQPRLEPKPVVLQQPMPVMVPPIPEIHVAPAEKAITVAPSSATPPERPAPVALAASPAPQPGPSTSRLITSGVEYIQAPQPVYPPMSRRMGEQGRVILRVLVSEKGLPDQVTVQTSSGSARLDEAGRQAALRAVFKPHLEDGRPVAVVVMVPLSFQLG